LHQKEAAISSSSSRRPVAPEAGGRFPFQYWRLVAPEGGR